MISIKATDGTVTLSLAAGLERFEAEKPRILREIGTSGRGSRPNVLPRAKCGSR